MDFISSHFRNFALAMIWRISSSMTSSRKFWQPFLHRPWCTSFHSHDKIMNIQDLIYKKPSIVAGQKMDMLWSLINIKGNVIRILVGVHQWQVLVDLCPWGSQLQCEARVLHPIGHWLILTKTMISLCQMRSSNPYPHFVSQVTVYSMFVSQVTVYSMFVSQVTVHFVW